eukprot:TRINITY_DN18868_c0_g1_i2.p1 TRINITY_DN18868_c0_g1~~TRINITY_DN18868_c0_g1_i2.p1  ORF type:complete len:314 (+),score=63.45 TRINITY_DN18868_c0_g1_i2:23-943(+)
MCIRDRLLIPRLVDTFEFEEVRRLAAELVGRLQPGAVFPTVVAGMQSTDRFDADTAIAFKASLLACCHGCVNHGAGMLPWAEDIFKCTLKALEDCTEHPDQQKLQLGSIDTAAMLLQMQIQHADSEHQPRVLQRVLSILDVNFVADDAAALKLQVSMANVITQVTKMAPSLECIECLARHMINPLIEVTVSSTQDLVLRAASCQALFNTVFRLSGGNAQGSSADASSALPQWADDLQRLCVTLIQEPAEELRLAGLKLAGVVLPFASVAGASDVSEELAQGLLTAAQSDQADAVRTLAKQFLSGSR